VLTKRLGACPRTGRCGFDELTTNGKNPLVLGLSKEQERPRLKLLDRLSEEALKDGSQGAFSKNSSRNSKEG
jgi:hypothetical protein